MHFSCLPTGLNWRASIISSLLIVKSQVNSSTIDFKQGDTITIPKETDSILFIDYIPLKDVIGLKESNVRYIQFICEFDGSKFESQYLPSSMDKLRLTRASNIEVGSIPSTVRILEINKHHIKPGVLPESIRNLILTGETQFFAVPNPDIVPGVVPCGTVHLCLNQRVMPDGLIPPSVKSLVTVSLQNLPATIESIVLVRRDQVMRIEPGQLPPALTSLDALSMKCELVVGSFPIGLIKLKVDSDQLLPGIIPSTVTKLTIKTYKPLLANVIPDSVTNLTLNNYGVFEHPLTSDILPSSLKKFKLKGQQRNHLYALPRLPSTLTHLTLTLSILGAPFTAESLPATCHTLKTSKDNFLRFFSDMSIFPETLGDITIISPNNNSLVSETPEQLKIRRISKSDYLLIGDKLSSGIVNNDSLLKLLSRDKQTSQNVHRSYLE
ncbi:hypothetical protein PPL_00431 [Heterostelium album PN500]|uniref:Uncharacterized protein n=1 Tax=Heterostelium pallidum (strain ATCC 26659 / Pp 5 / PN500) TaxID=670386 RepID=D3AWF7_HETP5|nr:hypothetical protein PPL_00431 [Heterostelium album PN500]EFA86630.1 hypothetical protein PPL_00431 [Heterostelium album PN500]|eukprot:XP_020438735.1 hypothetical protein PPL_00431 [Heterostelium album PN500]